MKEDDSIRWFVVLVIVSIVVVDVLLLVLGVVITTPYCLHKRSAAM